MDNYNEKDIEKSVTKNGFSNTGETFGITLSKKCERLATAVYLVTSFLLENEPLRYRLRNLSIDFIRDAAQLNYNLISSEINIFDVLQRTIKETRSLLELGFIAGIISDMNFRILKREYGLIETMINNKKDSRESRTDSILGDTFFGSSFHTSNILTTKDEKRNSTLFSHPSTEVNNLASENGWPKDDLVIPTPPNHEANYYKGHNDTEMSDRIMSDKDNIFFNSHPPVIQNTSPTIPPKVAIQLPKRTQLKPKSLNSDELVIAEANYKLQRSLIIRRECILKLIKDKNEVSIKDISLHFPDLSEKTIQRELVAGVFDGILKKSGDRRWSRYSMAN